MGYPASGKTILAREYQEQSNRKINRDELGGSLNGLVQNVKRQYNKNYTSQFIMDNSVFLIIQKSLKNLKSC